MKIIGQNIKMMKVCGPALAPNAQHAKMMWNELTIENMKILNTEGPLAHMNSLDSLK